MPSIEELLNEAEMYMANEPVNDILEIDIETREIYIPDSEIILGVETDQKAERKYFRCPRIVGNNIDLSELELYVVFQNAGGELEENRDRYHVTDVETTEDGYITFSWELTAKVTEYMGNVQFGVCAIRTDSSGTKQNVWNTTIAIGKCLIGLSADMSEEEQQTASDLYTQLVTELNNIATNRISEINTTADSRLEEYNDNATTKVKQATDKIQTAGNNQITYINNAGSTQTKNVADKGAEVLASIPTDYTELVNRVETNENNIRTKAPAIVRSVTSESGEPVQVEGSADMPLQGMKLYGRSEQERTTGAQLFNVNDKVSGSVYWNDLATVDDDGYVTIVIPKNTTGGRTFYNLFTKASSDVVSGTSYKIISEVVSLPANTQLTVSSVDEWSQALNDIIYENTGISIGTSGGENAIYVPYESHYDASLDDKGLANFKAYLADNPLVVMTYLDIPIETDLTEAQLQAYKSLTTFKPTSIISNDAGAHMEVDYALDTETYINGLNNECNSNLDKLNETLAENKKSDELTQRRLDALWKLNQGVVYEFQSDNADAYQKDVPTGGRYVGLKQIGGKSLVWGQLYPYDFTDSSIGAYSNNNTLSVKDGVVTFKVKDTSQAANCNFGIFFENRADTNHKYLVSEEVKSSVEVSAEIFKKNVKITSSYKKVSNVIQATSSASLNYLGYVSVASGLDVEVNFKNVQLFDLTAMFGSGNEPSTVEEFEALFPDSYYPYSAPEVVHVGVETVESVGRNLLDADAYYGAYKQADGTYKANVKNFNAIEIPLKDYVGKQITISAKLDVESVVTSFYLAANINNVRKNGTVVYGGNTNVSKITVIPELEDDKVWFSYGSGSGNIIVSNFQFELGNTQTEYSPYTRNTLTIPESIRNLDGYGWSARNVYNYVDFENKKFHKRVGCVDLGTLEWSYVNVTSSDSTFKAFRSNTDLDNRKFQSALNDYLCAKYTVIGTRSASSDDKTISTYNVSNDNKVVVHDSSYTDTATFKTAMSGVLLYYELATEVVTDISDLLADLNEDAFVLPVETGGTLTFKNSLGDGYRIPVPNSEEYILKLSEVASNE